MSMHLGKIVIDPDINIWPHELRTARALAEAGYTVEFVRKSEVDHEKSADALVDGTRWEFKAPISSKINMIQINIRRALHQADCAVFDSRRMKKLPDKVIEREVRLRSADLKSLKRLMYINRKGEVVIVK